jgi:hypothetical protein
MHGIVVGAKCTGRGAYDAVGRNNLDLDTELQDCRGLYKNKQSRSALLAPAGVGGSRESFEDRLVLV